MKGTEKIIAHIQADAMAQVAEILSEGSKQWEEIRAEQNAKANRKYDAQMAEGKAECEEYIASNRRLDSMNAKKELLAFKQDMVAQAFEKAQDLIPQLPKEEYLAFLAGLAAKASSSHDEKIVLNAKDRAELGTELVNMVNAKLGDGKLSLSEDTGDFTGGLILRQGENIAVNCTVELLTSLKKAELSADVAKILFN